MLDKMLSGIGMSTPKTAGTRLAEYEREKQRNGQRYIDNFTPDPGWEDLSAMGLIRAFFKHPLEGIVKRK